MHDQRIQIGCAAATGDADGGDAKRDIRPVLSRGLRDLSAAHQFERRLAVLRSGVEAGVVKRRPARIAYRIGHPKRRPGRGTGGEIDPYLELARRLDRAVRLKSRDLAVDIALLAFRFADRSVSGRDLLRNRNKGSAPFGDRTRFAFLAYSRRRGFRKPLGEFAARGGGGNRALEIGVLVLQRFNTLVEL